MNGREIFAADLYLHVEYVTGTIMALMMGNLYDALRSANGPDDNAPKAAEEVAGFENQISDVKSDMKLLKWMVGAILALELAQFAQALL